MSDPLDPFLPTFDAREHFAVRVRAPADLTFRVAADFDMQSPGAVRAIFRLREILLGSRATAPPPSQGFLADMRAIGWGELTSVPGRLFVGGAHCQPWLPDVRFHPLGAATFSTFSEPGVVKIAWTVEAAARGPHECILRTETRACATSPDARRRFLRYWRWARFGIMPIRWFLLPAIRREAERTEVGGVVVSGTGP